MTRSGPYRADQVGSLLRPEAVKTARAAKAAGKIDAQQLKAVEDEAIREVVRRQEDVGLQAVTDGEIRRENWSLDFFSALKGVKVEEMATAPRAQGSAAPVSNVLKVAKVVGKVALGDHPMIQHFAFLKANTKVTAKITVPAPTMIVSASRDWRQIIDPAVYSGLDAFFEDIAVVYQDLIKALYAQGCRYLQLDDVNMSYLCDSKMRAGIAARGDDPEKLLGSWVKVLDAVASTRPSDMTLTTHVCRGNFRSAWFAEGGYEPVADALFNRIGYDGYFLEYDSERAGGFEPLRFLPRGDKRVVLGLMTTKTGQLEDRALIRSRVEAATEFAPLEQLCLSPQCGFASHEDGNLLSESEEWKKLQQVVDLSREIWGTA